MYLGYVFPKITTILCFLKNFRYILNFMGIFFKNALLCGVRNSRQGVKQGKEERPAERRAVWQLWDRKAEREEAGNKQVERGVAGNEEAERGEAGDRKAER